MLVRRIVPLFFTGAALAVTASTLGYATELVSSVSYVASPAYATPAESKRQFATTTSAELLPSIPEERFRALYIKIAAEPARAPVRAPGEVRMEAYITGYSYWDNTPPGSVAISHGIVHTGAGGSGTYADPITLAVGHSLENGVQTLQYPPGTRFYFPYLQKYVMVEDTCGDGERPQDGPCYTGFEGRPWLDVYVDGANISKTISDQCMNAITGIHPVIRNPAPNYTVTPGSLSETGCNVF